MHIYTKNSSEGTRFHDEDGKNKETNEINKENIGRSSAFLSLAKNRKKPGTKFVQRKSSKEK